LTESTQLKITLPGVARRLSLFCFAKKVTKKGEPAAPLFVFVLLSPLFLLTIGRRENSLSPSTQI
jgi:uncharacterized paraquat-inducible protein A